MQDDQAALALLIDNRCPMTNAVHAAITSVQNIADMTARWQKLCFVGTA